ncbi:hypothetical protein ABEU86_14620 [Pseudomonas paraversuta]|uniref:hypothetical protein n=1 Tax=Pseudomonas paraversuta TaxID=2750624 RepID=UPI003D2E92C2
MAQAYLALLAHERRQVRSDELSEVLELADAPRLWALSQLEEAEVIGLFEIGGQNVSDMLPIFRIK